MVAVILAGCGSTGAPAPASAPPTVSGAPATPIAGASEAALLGEAWQGYRSAFIQADGRVVDPEREGVSTSEGESYAMLRAVWMDDRTTFDHAWRWTQDNLGVAETGLFGYLWGNDGHGTYRLLSRDSAADADEDIALALLLASRRWGDTAAAVASRTVQAAIWTHDVATVAGRPYLSAGSWAPGAQSSGLVVDPSYMAPYAYRLFAVSDPGLPWMQLVSTAYAVVRDCSAAPLSSGASAGLPPNWCTVTGSGGVGPARTMPQADDYGYDAFRTMWRIAVDVLWNGSADGRDYLASAGSFLQQRWQRDGRLAPEYTHDGRSLGGAEDPTTEGGDVGAFLVDDPTTARAVLTRLTNSFGQDGGAHFGDPHNYYEQNWVWFGIALATGTVQSFG